MSRRTKTTRMNKPRVTAAVSVLAEGAGATLHPEHELHRHADDGGPVPETGSAGCGCATEANIPMSEAEEAVDEALQVGRRIGHLEQIVKGIMPSPEQIAKRQDIAAILQEVFEEVLRASNKHKPMNSSHEGYAVLLEEVDELWAEVKADRGYQQSGRTEAIHVAAMAVRYMLDLKPGK